MIASLVAADVTALLCLLLNVLGMKEAVPKLCEPRFLFGEHARKPIVISLRLPLLTRSHSEEVPLCDPTMPNIPMRRLIAAAILIGYIVVGNQLDLPILCNETDAPLIFQEKGNSSCWKCECFDNKHWGCFQGFGNCSNAVPPTLGFRTCENTACDGGGICFPHGTGDLWLTPTNELCWCDNGDANCTIDSSFASNETNDFRNITDYRNSGIVCVKDETLYFNFGDAILSNCSICTCINGSFWCSELEACENSRNDGRSELACPLMVEDECLLPPQTLCINDSYCTGNKKCCVKGCLKLCVEAVPSGSVTKAGICPDLQIRYAERLPPCHTDYDCENHLKCCLRDTMYVCLEPYNPNDCENGENLAPCTFRNPCETTRCPKHPEARCRISHCGTCHAQYFVDNIRVNCYDDDVCNIDTPMLPCYLHEGCNSQYSSCRRVPHAECRVNYCGRCFFEFFNTNGSKVACFEGDPCPVGIREFSCGHTCDFCPEAPTATCVPSKCGGCGSPTYYHENGTEAQCFNLKDNCPEGSIFPSSCRDYCNHPSYSCTNPDVFSCKINYCGGKCTSEYFDVKGERVSCFGGAICPAGQRETRPCSTNCNRSHCYAYPNAVCKVSSCDYRCDVVFYDPHTLTEVNCSEGYTCPEENPSRGVCLGYNQCRSWSSCSRHPDAQCFTSPCGFCHTEYYDGRQRVNCYGDIPCPQGIAEDRYCDDPCVPTAYCPANLSAICLRKQCGRRCEPVFQDLEGNIIEDCFSGIQCPSGEVDALCPYNLCKSATCETHPTAECRLNHCGTCRAQFFLPNGTEITTCFKTSCANGLPPLSCREDLCSGIVCSNYPNANCSVNSCAQCTIEFFNPDGVKLTAEDCGGFEREGFCPKYVYTYSNSCVSEEDCVAPLKCCSRYSFSRTKFCVNPVKYHPLSCEYEGARYNPDEVRFGECELCTCSVGRWVCYDTKCNLTCPVDAPVMTRCNSNDCSPRNQICPAHPNARCTINPCGGCSVEHLDVYGTTVDCYDPQFLQCPEGQPPVPCAYDPCPSRCDAYPNAVCRLNVCGSCKAEHVLDNRTVDCFEKMRCLHNGIEYTDIAKIRTSDTKCSLCLCLMVNLSICLPFDGPCALEFPCMENGVEYPPLFARRENCTECVCSFVVNGQFTCLDIPNCVDYQKEGVCPPKQGSPDDCVEEVIHECDHDGNCTGSNKCCHEYCGSICEKPVPEGPTCFSCISYFSNDIPNTEDTCSDVAVPNVDVVKCITGMVCSSIRAEATLHDSRVMKSINVVRRGCYWPGEVPQNASGCILGNDTATLPDVYAETEAWVRQHETKISLINSFVVSACFCEEYKCNSVIPPLPPTSTQVSITETTLQPTFETTDLGGTSLRATLSKSQSPISTLRAASTQAPITETTLQPTFATTTLGATPSRTTSPKALSPSTGSLATSTQAPMTETTSNPISAITAHGSPSSEATSPQASSQSTFSQENFCSVQGKPSKTRTFQTNLCTNCLCSDGFFLCRFNGTCTSDVSVVEVSYTLKGSFADITGHEKQFGRTLIQSLAKELMIDETVFLDVMLSAGSIKVKQNVTDSNKMNITAKDVSKQIQQKVVSGKFSFMFNGKIYQSEGDTFEVSQSYKFSSGRSSSISVGVVVLIIIAVMVAVSFLIFFIIMAFRKWAKQKADTDMVVLMRLSRSPSLNSTNASLTEFENPSYTT